MSHRFQSVSTCRFGFAILWVVCWICIDDAANGRENWARFHGPNGSGLAKQATLPKNISEENYRWRLEFAGIGSSSPVIWEKRISSEFSSSPVATAKHIYVTDNAGHLYVIAVSNEYNRLPTIRWANQRLRRPRFSTINFLCARTPI